MLLNWINSLFTKEKYTMDIKTSLKEMEKNFLGNSRELITCPKCNKDYLAGVLDKKSDYLVCPQCDNGKD